MNKNILLISLLKVTFIVLIAIAVFEYAKYMIFPGLTVFYSHIIGITVGVIIIGITAYRVQKIQEQLLVEKIAETERRMQSEASLLDVEGKYCKLFIDSMDGVCQTTLDGKIIEANKSFCEIFYCDADKIVGESITQFYDNPEDRIKFRNEVEINRGVKNYEIVLKRTDGQKIICSISSSCCYSINKEMSGFMSIVRDITELKRMEEEQRKNRGTADRLAEEKAVIAEIGRLIGSTLDIDEVYERFASETSKLLPFDRVTINLNNHDQDTVTIAYAFGPNVPGRRVGDSFPLKGSVNEVLARTKTGMLLHPKNADELTEYYPHLVSTFQEGIKSFMSVPLISRDELIGVLHFRAKKPDAYSDRDLRLAERVGMQIAGAIANAQLFAELKKTDRSLRESEGRFRALVEQAAVGVAEIEMSTGQFLTVNRRLCEMVGRTEDELLATTFQAITHPEDLHLHEKKTALLLASVIDHYSLEKRYLRKDRGIVWVNITVSPLWTQGEPPGRNMIVVEDITDRKRMEEALKDREKKYRELSIMDDLTQLYNSRHFYFQLKIEIDRSNRYGHPLTLLLLDLDNFKHFNDTYGHVEGDQVLMRLGQVVKRCLRETDFAYRYGGEEFTVLLPMTTSADAAVTAERVRTEFKKETFFPAPGQDVHKAVSIGLAQYRPQEEMKAFVHRVDQLMYQGKKSGKDRVCCES